MKLSNLMIDDIILNALKEDMPYGDISTDSIFDGSEISKGNFIAKEECIIAGTKVLKRVFEIVDERINIDIKLEDGSKAKNKDIIASIDGPTSGILKGERIALNLFQRMCGIATKTNTLVKALDNDSIRLVDTRKTTPGLRVIEKYAVTVGGGYNHRYSLSDAVMLKDNHINAMGSILEAVKKARKNIPHTTSIEVETENLEQVKEAIKAEADIIMLDNMDPSTIKKAIDIINKKAIIEVSGNIDINTINDKAIRGVNIISSGALTHSVKATDISLKFSTEK